MNTEPPITNPERAERARKALEVYSDEYDPDSNMIDFLADLQHYCHIAHTLDNNQRTFDDMLRIARQHFDAEISG
jgi:hypothetical protein